MFEEAGGPEYVTLSRTYSTLSRISSLHAAVADLQEPWLPAKCIPGILGWELDGKGFRIGLIYPDL